MTHRRPCAITADETVGRTGKRSGRAGREDLLLACISLVKDGRNYAEPADFVSDVALTFQALTAGTSQDGDIQVSPAMPASIISGPNTLGTGRDWPVAS